MVRSARPPAFERRRVIAVDVDRTLIVDGEVNSVLAQWCRDRRADGYVMILWSARGEAHARGAADRADLMDVFDHILTKPGFIVDDEGWGWIKYTQAVSPGDIAGEQEGVS